MNLKHNINDVKSLSKAWSVNSRKLENFNIQVGFYDCYTIYRVHKKNIFEVQNPKQLVGVRIKDFEYDIDDFS